MQAQPVPDVWMHDADVCALVGAERALLARWRRDGTLPAGMYQAHGRGHVFDQTHVDALKARLQGAAVEFNH
jgi:predicted site-specific integrase-resolvase